MVKKINWGIIGLGNIALHFANAIKLTVNANLKGVSSKEKNKIKKFQQEFQIDNKYCFNNYEDLISCDEIDAIYIALPNSLHFEFIIKCIEAKKKILIEKPITINFSEIKEIKRRYDTNNFFISEAFMYLHHPQIIKIIDLLKNNEIGKIISIRSSFGKDILTKKKYLGFKIKKKQNMKNRLFNPKLGGGAILDLGCYPVSFCVLVASLFTNVKKEEIELSNIKKEIGSTGVDLNSSLEIQFKSTLKAYIKVSFTENIGSESVILGEKGKLIVNDTWHANPAIVKVIKDQETEIVTQSKYDAYYYQINNISNNILQEKKIPDFPAININSSYINMSILDKWIKNEK